MIVGSFATVLAYRVPRHQSFVMGRSSCPSCGATIAAYDNVPVISWLVLRGRCRSCRAPISARYPLTELAMAALFAATVLILGVGDLGDLVLGLVLCTLLVTVTLTDLERRVIPNLVLLIGAIAGVAISAVAEPGSLAERAVAAGLAGGALFCVALAYPRGMGMGDVKLAAVLGIYLGRAVAPAMLIAFAAGGAYGLWLIARHGGEARKRAIPFGPFLALGGVIGLWCGDAIVGWYLHSVLHR
jgi:leader peptidase (prepilin peptidase) / N-methyltransferase